MDWLIILISIGIVIYNSVKESNKAKQQREKRAKRPSQTVYSESGHPAAEKKSIAAQPQKKGLLDSLNEFLENLDDQLESSEQKKTTNVPTGTSMTKATAKKKKKKAVPQTVKKSPAELPKQTLMEQRPERERREAHTKVSANVKPLKSAYQNDEQCEHRIELNPNIQYSGRKKQQEYKQAALIRTDKESLIQGIVWSEILGKPKAYQKQENIFERRHL